LPEPEVADVGEDGTHVELPPAAVTTPAARAARDSLRAFFTAFAKRSAFLRNCASDGCWSAETVTSTGPDADCTTVTDGAGAASPAVASGLLLAAQSKEPAAIAATIGETTAAADQLA
jgi:hypothetical protein